jgi:hypothetical protein
MELQPGTSTDAIPGDRNEPDSAGGHSLKTGDGTVRERTKAMDITFLIGKIIFGGYWLMLAPVLFLPLGTVLLSWEVVRGIFGYLVLLLAVIFAASGVVFLLTLTLPDAVTVFAGVLAIWSLAATITLVARKWGIRCSPSQQLRTAKSSIT